MSRHAEFKPTAVPFPAKQVGETESRWDWVEPGVWTDRMLTALDSGVKGGQWFSLIDKVYRERNLFAAFRKVAANDGVAGVDHVSIARFEQRLRSNLSKLSEQLQDGSYRPQAIRRHYIPKPGSSEKRPLGIPTVRDRVVQTALRNVLEPIFEKDFAEQSYGFRPGRGCKDALCRVDALLKKGYTHVVDADLKSYFDTIPHERLMALIGNKISDSRVLELIRMFLQQRVLDDLAAWTPEAGSPQGAAISPLLSNIYLDPLDHQMAEQGFEMIRYADDFVILCRTREDAERALAVVGQWTAQAGLTLHPDKTHIVDAAEGDFDFLGYTFTRGYRYPRAKSLKKFKDTIRRTTKRQNGHSLPAIIARLNPTLRGWFEYFQHSQPRTFEPLDGWIRMRLRSILRRRQKRKGRGRGWDHHRWKNAYFAERGLYSLRQAHVSACQSSLR
ncbi:MAG: group II intron reverse transcriptase/maturase [Gemmatimonadota bacterium]|nr:group II intron reverse transcriptase/maturase [Gemmatimonadota bacterium]